jgi:hypothetical protein
MLIVLDLALAVVATFGIVWCSEPNGTRGLTHRRSRDAVAAWGVRFSPMQLKLKERC